MTIIDERTPALALPLPHPENDIGDDVLRLRAALIGVDTQIDQVIQTLQSGNPDVTTFEDIVSVLSAHQLSLTNLSDALAALVDDGAPDGSKVWSSEKVAAEIGQGSDATYTYTAGVLTGISETLPGGTRTTVLTYSSGVLATMAVTYAGVTRTTTYTYTSGVLTSTSTVES